jgi:hypothetical protein
MGELAIGVLGIMAYPLRGHFWLATIVALTVQYIGDGAGHIYFWVVWPRHEAPHCRAGARGPCATATFSRESERWETVANLPACSVHHQYVGRWWITRSVM